MAPDKPGFFEELKRRHVWRVVVAYLVAAWLLVQVATQVFPFFHIPDWSVRLVVILLAIGFPMAVAFAWIYELTPEGLRRTEPADSPEARPHTEYRQIGRKLNALIVAVLVLAVALLGWRLIAVRRAPAPAVAKAAATSATPAKVASKPAPAVVPTPERAIPAKSVAVLPFVNESGEKSQQYFSDGLSEDLITTLSQFAWLKVISRDSAFQFRNSKDTSAEIGASCWASRTCWKARCSGRATRCGSPRRWSMPPTAASCGPSVTTSRTRICLRCRAPSPRPCQEHSRRNC